MSEERKLLREAMELLRHDTDADREKCSACHLERRINALLATEPEPVAYVNLKRWLGGEAWPDDCFSDEPTGDHVTPLYALEASK